MATLKKTTTIDKHTQVRGSEGTIPTMACASPSVFIYGTSSEIRTHDQRIKSPLRYRCAMLAYFGRGCWTRTNACRNQNQMPYQLGESPTITESRIFKERARSIPHAWIKVNTLKQKTLWIFISEGFGKETCSLTSSYQNPSHQSHMKAQMMGVCYSRQLRWVTVYAFWIVNTVSIS